MYSITPLNIFRALLTIFIKKLFMFLELPVSKYHSYFCSEKNTCLFRDTWNFLIAL